MLLTASVLAQRPADIEWIKQRTDIAGLQKLSVELKVQYERNWQKILRLAKRNNWPLKKKMQTGNTGYLAGITSDLKPIYAQTLNGGSAATVHADRLYAGGGLGLIVEGNGMKVGIWDDGMPKPDHELLAGKINQMQSGIPVGLHATRIAGTIIGKDIVSNRNARGIAFMATADCYTYDSNTLSNMATAAANGLLISNHSYTLGGYSPTYNTEAQALDDIMFTAPYYLPVFAAGNTYSVNINGLMTYSITSEAAAKNNIAVANVYELRNYIGPGSVVIYSGINASSQGPTTDFRIKPDISAKGVGTYTSYYDSPTSYGLEGGTSEASAAVSGTLLLLQQHYHNLNSPAYMKAATLKCLVLHTAYEAGPNSGPDITYGWGLLNAEEAANTITQKGKSCVIEENTLSCHASGNSYTKTVVASGGQPLKVSICWADKSSNDFSSSTATRIIKDLDLRVSDGITTYYPWRLDQSNISGAALNNGDNDRDNVERVEIPNPVFGATYTITVTHKGTHYQPDHNSQDYSLVVTGVTNCTLSSPPNLSLSSPITSGIEYKGYNTITSTSVVSDNITVKFSANAATLNQGFWINRAGSSGISGFFLASSGPCQDNNNPPLRQTSNRDVIANEMRDTTTALSLKNAMANASIQCVPNPSNGAFRIYLKNADQGYLEIFDVSGKTVMKADFFKQNVMDIDIRGIAKGIYFLKINTQKRLLFEKIIVH